jgi:hypothetical protein
MPFDLNQVLLKLLKVKKANEKPNFSFHSSHDETPEPPLFNFNFLPFGMGSVFDYVKELQPKQIPNLPEKKVLEPDPDLLSNSIPPEYKPNLARNPLADIPKTRDLPMGSTSPGLKSPDIFVPPMPASATRPPVLRPTLAQAYLMKTFVPGMKHLPLVPFVRPEDIQGLSEPQPEVPPQEPGWLQRNWKEVGLFGLGAGGTALLTYLLRNNFNDKKKLKKKVKEEDDDTMEE